MTDPKCGYCQEGFMDDERVVFNYRDTFTFKPAHVPDTVNPAKVTASELAESRKDYTRTAVVSTFCNWGKAVIPEGAFNFRHQWCEPQRTGADVGKVHPLAKHSVRYARGPARRVYG